MARFINHSFRVIRKSTVYNQTTVIPVWRCYSSNTSELVPVVFADDKEKKRREASWRKMKYSFVGFGASFGMISTFLAYKLGSPKTDACGKIIEDEFSSMPTMPQFLHRIWKHLIYFSRVFREPSRDKLLPDPVSWPYVQPPYTLVLEMTNVLFHAEWSYTSGWRFKKRPGVAYFLKQVSTPMYEVVIYTAEQGPKAIPIINALDPEGYIMYRLVRDSTHFVDGHHVKNLDYLNRDLSKVIVIDWDKDSVKYHPKNAFILPQWRGNDDDKTLYNLASFLQIIATFEVEDLREVIDYYNQFENPLEMFRENQKKFLERMEVEEKEKVEPPQKKPLTKR